MTGSSTTNSILVDFANDAQSGEISVKAVNNCNETEIVKLAVTVKPLIGTIGTISGNATVCAGEKGITYSVAEVANAKSYTWTLPNGMTGSSTTNSILVDFANDAQSGEISVKAVNDCNETEIVKLAVTVKPLIGTIGTISGNATVCAGEKGITYSVAEVANAKSYTWTLPNGMTGSSTTNSILVDFANDAQSGEISVKAVNDCNETEIVKLAVTVKPLIGTIGTISGNATVCAGEKGITYSVAEVANAKSYTWTLPNGMTGSSTTNSILVDFANDAQSGEISVKAVNDCNETSVSKLFITVIAKPATPLITRDVNILHSNANQGNQWYNSKGLINGATNQDYSIVENEDYYVVVTINGCSSDKSNVIKVTNTSLFNVIDPFKVSIYPNPAKNYLNIEFDGEIEYELCNSIGQIIYNGNLIKSTLLNVQKLTKGLYIIRFKQGNEFVIRKFVKD